jgi:hypothetical protein
MWTSRPSATAVISMPVMTRMPALRAAAVTSSIAATVS